MQTNFVKESTYLRKGTYVLNFENWVNQGQAESCPLVNVRVKNVKKIDQNLTFKVNILCQNYPNLSQIFFH